MGLVPCYSQRFDTDRDGALNFVEFEALVASLLGGCGQYGTASEVAAQIGIPIDMCGHLHARMHAFILPVVGRAF